MDYVRVLHCADFHIGAELSGLGGQSKKRKAEVKKTFFDVVDLCRQEQISLLLIAGDLFDSIDVSMDVVTEVRDALAGIPETVVAIATGNHDPALPGSFYADQTFWPENVILFTSQLRSVELPELGIRLWGAGFSASYCYRPMLTKPVIPSDDLINIGIIHGDMVADNGTSCYNAITPRQIMQCGLKYLALGHVHKRSEPKKVGECIFSYPGSPEGTGFDELGDHGVYLLRISKDNCRIAYKSMCHRKYLELNVDIEGVTNGTDILTRIHEKMQEIEGEDYENHLYKVVLEGELDGNVILRTEEIVTALEDVFYVKVVDRTHLMVEREELMKETSLRGIFAKKISQLENDGNSDKVNLALELGLKAFYGDVLVPNN